MRNTHFITLFIFFSKNIFIYRQQVFFVFCVFFTHESCPIHRKPSTHQGITFFLNWQPSNV
uniref:Uncharacterized protein n=1 Tax=Meloidogyne enterolobii TaxID=390850 RepID=A0A6V7X0A6_MELEN|nr:unnamed protein product [Meloidogyne enterolobii]